VDKFFVTNFLIERIEGIEHYLVNCSNLTKGNMMKKILTIFTMIILGVLSFGQVNAEEMQHDSPLYAVAFHADWCPGCKVLGPNMKKARADATLDAEKVLFVKLDLTDDVTKNQAHLMANALGLGDFYKSNAGKTGFVLLVDAKTGEHVGKVTHDMDAMAIVKEIKSHI
jgi:thiol-disulfide isomerase/thioredoxin